MFSGLSAFGHSIWSFVTPESLMYVFGSTLIGLVIGALPGLTATMGLALMTTLTLKMESGQALLVLICTYVGAIYGGSAQRPSCSTSRARRPIRRRASTAHALARQGHAGRAMGIATSGSCARHDVRHASSLPCSRRGWANWR
jgi:putative tricarboxylic transport membrane protein